MLETLARTALSGTAVSIASTLALVLAAKTEQRRSGRFGLCPAALTTAFAMFRVRSAGNME
jgi:hypothetical protein